MIQINCDWLISAIVRKFDSKAAVRKSESASDRKTKRMTEVKKTTSKILSVTVSHFYRLKLQLTSRVSVRIYFVHGLAIPYFMLSGTSTSDKFHWYTHQFTSCSMKEVLPFVSTPLFSPNSVKLPFNVFMTKKTVFPAKSTIYFPFGNFIMSTLITHMHPSPFSTKNWE